MGIRTCYVNFASISSGTTAALLQPLRQYASSDLLFNVLSPQSAGADLRDTTTSNDDHRMHHPVWWIRRWGPFA